ncbi:unnamed protein product [Ostreobium quekettii]|uniref:TATA box binding protein associated factor (TAF) histone-like fold domain-containing protein n=1 Tax=Ostreobium quekettii TaxID=121088 RepID=A0A8S1JDG7_9CHLO|nr:unnamed protein product [Ostreobium quekettii]|eukprot:evm.model.scf_219.8 EVM.evm.TU.scf_219.8   scf_219:69154-82998(+)
MDRRPPAVQAKDVQTLCPALELSEEAARALGGKLEGLLRAVIKDCAALARHSRRVRVTTEDVRHALQARGCEHIYGAARFQDQELLVAQDTRGVLFAKDPELKVDEIDSTSFDSAPTEDIVHMHWLAIDGVQPVVPENKPAEAHKTKRRKQGHTDADIRPAKRRKGNSDGKSVGFKIRQPVVHNLTKEQQEYLKKIQSVVASIANADSEQLKESTENGGKVLEGLSKDAALQPLVPYLVGFMSQQLQASLQGVAERGPPILCILSAIEALLKNPFIDLHRYASNVMALLLTCQTCRSIGSIALPSHERVRHKAGAVLAVAVDRFRGVRESVTKELIKAVAGDKPLAVQYGAIVGLSCLDLSTWARVVPDLAKAAKRLKGIVDQAGHKDADRGLAAKCLEHLEGLLRSNSVKSDTFRAAMSESMPELASTADGQQNGHSTS